MLTTHACVCAAELTKALGLELDATPALGNVRCRRFALVIDDNVVKV